jgi:protoporphyrinogen oxidase
MKIIILGAGPTGLGAAHRLHERAHPDWHVYERNGYVGGLSSSYVDAQGFTWDIGGHVLFSHYRHFDAVLEAALGGEYYEHARASWIRLRNTWIPYPFQNNIHHLPDTEMRECIEGLRDASQRAVDTNDFRRWMISVFGGGIVKYFMAPYNEKVWCVPLDSLGTTWLSERVSMVDLKRIERNAAEGRDDVGWGPNATFKFPKYGGTGAIFEAIAQPFRKRITFKKTAVQIDLDQKVITWTDGSQERYDALISTVPLDLFIHSCSGLPYQVHNAAEDLTHTGGVMVGLGFIGPRDDPKCWMYFPEENAPFYRVTNFHNYSPYNVPQKPGKQYFALMCETSYSVYKPVNKQKIIDDTLHGLCNTGLIEEDDRSKVISRYHIDVPYSYPVPTRSRDDALKIIQPYLEAHAVFSRGRFGAWKYEVGNMDHSFMQGVEAVDRILSGTEENTVNGRVAP